ncbi:MAG TPA: mechanosensitive ion channel domain-containing protein [Bacteroidales bacterium]|nr:mechanosensitive ion channel domain-containing protein [Bacteroidales bacterium]
METIKNFLEFEIFSVGKYSFTAGKVATTIIIVIVTLLVLRIIKKTLFRKKVRSRFEQGNLFSLYQIIKYVLWIISILLILETLGIKLNVILAGSAALLVGVGLGLQNTFNNFVSGIILLFEGSIKVGNILEIDGDVVKMERIGMRTSSAKNRDDIIIIIPNSLITSNKVINWSHQSEKTRFKIKVGVAYGSDVDLVLKVLRESALEHPEIKDKDSVNARFIDFGNSSLDFELLFFSSNIFRIENLKSEIRKVIYRKFTENNITIPFPQVDLHFKSDDTGYFKKV